MLDNNKRNNNNNNHNNTFKIMHCYFLCPNFVYTQALSLQRDIRYYRSNDKHNGAMFISWYLFIISLIKTQLRISCIGKKI